MPLATQRHEPAEADLPIELSAGPVSVELNPAGTALRDIAFDGEVVFRGLAFVARDENWGTLLLAAAPQIRRSENSIEIEAAGAGDHPNGDLAWHVLFRISPKGIEARTTARSSRGFLTNRTGLVVLHGLSACRSQEVVITHSDGRSTRSAFPIRISPHQPFLDMAALAHRTQRGTAVMIAFEGEVFETEDQRNWTDASYKTYSRPLALPFPYRIDAGETVEQSVRIAFEAGGTASASVGTDLRIEKTASLPHLGAGFPVVRPVPDEAISAALKELSLHAIALEIDPEEREWTGKLAHHLAAIPGNIRLNCRLKDHADHVTVLDTIDKVLSGRKPLGISLWDATQEAVDFGRRLWPDTPIGGGTGAFFTELNRGTLPSGVDYVTWTTNPTVHASDDDTLGESIEPLADILATAHAKAPGLDLVVGPLTLGMRFNPNATSPEARRAETPQDQRQHTVLAASWLLGTIAGFIDAAMKDLIVFEVTGPKGLVQPDGLLSPSGHLVSRLAPLAGCKAETVTWAHEPRARGLLVHTPKGRVLALTQARAAPASLVLPEGQWGTPERLTLTGFSAGSQQADGMIDVDGFGVVWVAEAS
jgi:D-apionolactonase